MTDQDPEQKEWPLWLIVLGLVLAIVSVQGRGLVPPDPAMAIRVDGQVIGTQAGSIEYDLAAKEIRIYTTEGVMCKPEPRFSDRFERDIPSIDRRPRR